MVGVRAKIEYNGHEIETIVKKGIIGTAEWGIINDGKEIPQSKLSIIVNDAPNGLSAWMVISEVTESGNFEILHEGWAYEKEHNIKSYDDESIVVQLEEVPLTDENFKSHADIEFGLMRCCTANGDGCYVRCCNSCCSDPTRCPGASCCG